MLPSIGYSTEVQASSDGQLVELWLLGRPWQTQRAYAGDIRRFCAFVSKPFSGVTLSDLQGFADSMGQLSAAAAYRRLSAAKSLLAFGYRIGYLRFDVGRVLRLPGVRNRLAERIISEADVHRMFNLESAPRNRAILKLLYASAIRVSELCGLRWRDVRPNGDAGQITVWGKGEKTRTVQIPESIWRTLEEFRGEFSEESAVFRSRKTGGPLDAAQVFRIVRAAAARAGVKAAVSPHWLRHAHASHALDRGAPIHLVQATLGHSSVATTGRYLHARPKESSSRYLAI